MDGRAFLTRVGDYRGDGWRLVVINATAVLPDDEHPGGAFDVSWSFAKDRAFMHLRERVLPGEEVPSVSGLYAGAFLYENELRELFGINVTGIAVDLRGQLYQTATRVPFAPSAIRARLEALGRAPGAKHEPKPAASTGPKPAPAGPAARPAAAEPAITEPATEPTTRPTA